MTKLIDQQLGRNDAGVSAIKTICNLYNVNISRKIIEDQLSLDSEGSSLGGIQLFLDEQGFSTEINMLDLGEVLKNPEKQEGFFPAITPVKVNNRLDYIIINGVKNNKFIIIDPRSVTEYLLTPVEFGKKAYFQKHYFNYIDETDLIWLEINKVFQARKMPLFNRPDRFVLLEMGNKLEYFLYLEEQYGFKNDAAASAFLKDLFFEQQLDNIPHQFRRRKNVDDQVELTAPILLSVQNAKETVTNFTREDKDGSIYWELFKSIGSLRSLWTIFLATILFAAFISYIGIFIDQILIDHILPSYQLGTLQLFAIGVGLFYLVEMIFKIYAKFVSIHLAASLDRFFLYQFDEKLNRFSLRYLARFKKGDLTERLRDSMKLKTFFVKYFSNIMVDVIIACVSLVFLVFINWRLSMLVGLILVLFMIQFRVFTPLIEKLEQKRYRRKADFMSKFLEKIEGIQVIKSLGLEKYSSNQVRSRVDGLLDIYIKSKYIGLANSIIASFIVSFATLALIVLTSRELILYQTISLGMIITFVAMSKKIFKAFSRLLDANLSLQEHRVILKRVFNFNETVEAEVPPSNNLIQRFKFRQLSLNNIDFSYNEEGKVLNAISMTVNHGDRIWIKGKNGTGKSTFCKIMTGLYVPDEGSIHINNIDTGLYHPKALNKTIALISGKDMVFNDTLLFNITFGRKVNMEELIEYAKMVNLYDFINSKNEKFDYVIHENGSNLSTGQRRKILLLRAIFLDAEVIILDEVFNGIDQESKVRIEQLIDLFDSKTFIIISHIPVNNIRLNKKFILQNGKFIHQNTESN